MAMNVWLWICLPNVIAGGSLTAIGVRAPLLGGAFREKRKQLWILLVSCVPAWWAGVECTGEWWPGLAVCMNACCSTPA